MSENKAQNTRKISASERYFTKYIRFIQEEIWVFGPSYSTVDTIKNNWRYDYEWSRDIEKFIILKTKTFIRLLNSDNGLESDPKFLEALIWLISDYLSPYFMRNPNTLTSDQAKNKLFTELWEKNIHIQVLLQSQSKKRYEKKYTFVNKRRPNKTKSYSDKAHDAHTRYVQIQFVVFDTPKKDKIK